MSQLRYGSWSVALSLVLASGCADEASLDSGREAAPTQQQASPPTVVGCEPAGEKDAGTTGIDAGSDDDDNGSRVDAGVASGQDAGGSTGSDPGGDMQSGGEPIAGSATKAKCSSIAKPSGDMCGSYYCGVNESQIEAELASDSLCPDVGAICEGRLVSVVAECTRSTLIANLGAGLPSLRPKIESCIYADAEFKEKMTPECLGCFMGAATCAAEKCLAECLSDGPPCDSCRQRNNCDQAVFSCAKLPNPF